MPLVGTIIPAIKKNVAFPDDIIKKLAGRTLIDRALEKVSVFSGKENTLVITDSEEIRQLCEHKGFRVLYHKDIQLSFESITKYFSDKELSWLSAYEYIVNLSVYSPLLKVEKIREALDYLKKTESSFLQPIVACNPRNFCYQSTRDNVLFWKDGHQSHTVSSAFTIIKTSALLESSDEEIEGIPFLLKNDTHEIHSYHDWWVCEKLINQKRILFHAIGNDKIGFGHVYRALTIAHEISDHEVIFICSARDLPFLRRKIDVDYELHAYVENEFEAKLNEIEPDLVINDILNTSKNYMKSLRKHVRYIVNFEDEGEGAESADLVVNSLLSNGQSGFVTGEKAFLLRDEFEDRRLEFGKVESILLIFGGSDPQNYTCQVLKAIYSICRDKNIKINVVTGPGYAFKKDFFQLLDELNDKLVTHISEPQALATLFLKSDIAICSNGRTKLELFHCGVPAIVIPQNRREQDRLSSSETRGIYLNHKSANLLNECAGILEKLIEDDTYRYSQFEKLAACDYSKNKNYILKKIEDLLKKEI